MASHDISKLVDGSGDEFNFRDPTKRSIIQDVSKGANLVVNGNGVVGTNYNFSARTFIANTDLPEGNAGCFHAVANNIWHDEPISVNVEKKYEAEVWYRVKSANTSTVRFSVACFDIDDNEIQAIFSTYGVGTLTELTQDLKPGDTVVHLADLSGANWLSDTDNHHGFIFWNYQNSLGYTYPPETYSRNVYPQNNVYLWDDSSAVNVANGTITLKAAWSGPTIPAGTKVSRMNIGGVYAYVEYTTSSGASTSWEKLSGIVQNMTNPGSTAGGFFRKGTAYIRIGFYNSGTDNNEYIEFTGLSLRELPDRISTARKLKTNLGRTADSTFDGSADQVNIPVTGTLPVANGGTGATTAIGAEYNILNQVEDINTTVDGDRKIALCNQTKSASNGVFRWIKLNNIWTWIKGKLSSDSGVNVSGNAATATKATQDGSGNTIDGTYKKHATNDKFVVPQWIDDNTRTSYQDIRIGNKFKLLSVGISGTGNLLIKELADGRDNSPSEDKSIIYTSNGGTSYNFNGNASTATALVDDSGYVHTSGNESIGGTKKFTAKEVYSESTEGSWNGFLAKRTNTSTNKTYKVSLEAGENGDRGIYDYDDGDHGGENKWLIKKDANNNISIGESSNINKVSIGGVTLDFSGTLGSNTNTLYFA